MLIPILKKVHLRQLKGMQSSKQSTFMWKGYHLSIEGIQKGNFLVKNGI